MLTEQGQPGDQRETGLSGEFVRLRERAHARRAGPAARGGGGRQEQSQPGVVSAGGAGEAEEGAERHAAGEEDHRGLGAKVQGRNGKGTAPCPDCSFLFVFVCVFSVSQPSVYF